MCLICIDLDRGALKFGEARRALGEMRVKLDSDHVRQVEAKIAEAEAKVEAEPDADDA